MKLIDVADIVPTKNGIIIKEFERDTQTDSGLVLPEAQTSGTPVIGEVVTVGEGSKYKPGDIVLFRRYSVDELPFLVDGKKVTVNLISDEEVVAYVKQHEI